MGAPVTFSHDDIDQGSIQAAQSFGHDDIDMTSIAQPKSSQEPSSWLQRSSKALNSVTLAPVESAIYAAQNGQNPFKAYGHQFANTNEDAPTGADIAAKAGFSTDNSNRNVYMNNPQGGAPIQQPLKGRSNADMIGFGIDQAANPLNYAGPVLEGAGKVIAPIADAASGALKGFAEDAAVNATGATGKQASTFAPTAGRELLDRGIVKFGNSQKQIAQKAADAVDQANVQIDQSLKALQAKGVTVDSNTVYNTVRDTINKMKADPSKADIANKLEGELNNLVAASEARGTTKIPIQDAEAIKRGYGAKAGNWADPDASQAGKAMYQTFRGAVEDAGQAADPATTQAFQEGKQTYGLLTPIQEAAARRAMTANQHQAGGFLDIAGTLAGDAVGGPAMAIAAPIARRVIAPRIGSSVAVAADQAGNLLKNAPEVLSHPAAAPALGFTASGVNPAQSFPNAADQQTPGAPMPNTQPAPNKGPEKWAQDGFQNLKGHVNDEDRKWLEENKSALMVDPAAKKLLVTGSNFSPGTKPLDDIIKHLKNRFEDDEDEK